MATAAPGGTPGGETGRARRRRTRARVISLLSDYGLADGFVGALHSVLRARLPDVAIVDLTHEVRPQDVRAGSLALRRAAPYLAAGVVVAIVDPGVGTTRRPLAVQAAGADLVLIGPDNGLLVPALEHLGGAALAIVLENPAYRLASPGPTFAGRDIFAPAAAHLAGGGEIGVLGREVGPGSLVRLPAPVCRKSGRGTLEAEVTWVDRYGNVQLAASAEALTGTAADVAGLAGPTGSTAAVVGGAGGARGEGGPGAKLAAGNLFEVSLAGHWGAGGPWRARLVRTYSDLAPGELGILIDSYGYLALCLNGASSAEHLGAAEQDVVVLRPAGPQAGPPPAS